MKSMKRFLAILLMFTLLVGCTTPATKPNDQDVSNDPSIESPETNLESADDSYTSLDDFVLWDADGKLTTEGRGATGTTGVVASGKYEASKIGKEIM